MGIEIAVHEPSSDDCTAFRRITVFIDGEAVEGYATWYPQMGGYAAKALVVAEGSCFGCYVWHDGEFPFGYEERSPAYLHHCDPEQFISFGETVRAILARRW